MTVQNGERPGVPSNWVREGGQVTMRSLDEGMWVEKQEVVIDGVKEGVAWLVKETADELKEDGLNSEDDKIRQLKTDKARLKDHITSAANLLWVVWYSVDSIDLVISESMFLRFAKDGERIKNSNEILRDRLKGLEIELELDPDLYLESILKEDELNSEDVEIRQLKADIAVLNSHITSALDLLRKAWYCVDGIDLVIRTSFLLRLGGNGERIKNSNEILRDRLKELEIALDPDLYLEGILLELEESVR